MIKHRIAHNTITVFSANIIQAALGFSVSAFVAFAFGSAAEVDAFFIVAPLPILIGQFTLSVSLVGITPHYQKQAELHGREAALREIAPLFWTWSLLVLLIVGLGYLVIEPLATMLAPGFTGERMTLLVTYLRWALLAAPLISAAGFLQALENADGYFFRAAFARPLITAVALGALITLFAERGLEPFFMGLFVGSALATLWQFFEVRSFGAFPISIRGVGKVWSAVRSSALAMALARGIGHGSELGLQVIASLAAAGVVATYGFGFRIAAIPLMFSISMALALFPAQSAAYAKNNAAESMRILWRGVNALTILGALFGGFFFVWAEPLVILLYERGDFNPALTAEVARTIRIFSLGLMMIAANNAIANGFWAAKRMKERIIIEAIAIGILLLGAGLSIQRFGPVGLAGAYVLEFAFLFFVGLWRLESCETNSGSRLRLYFTRLATFAKVSAVVGVLIVLSLPLSPSSEVFRSLNFAQRIGLIGASSFGFALLYFAGLYALKINEARDLVHLVLNKLSRSKNTDTSNSKPEDSPTTHKRQSAGIE